MSILLNKLNLKKIVFLLLLIIFNGYKFTLYAYNAHEYELTFINKTPYELQVELGETNPFKLQTGKSIEKKLYSSQDMKIKAYGQRNKVISERKYFIEKYGKFPIKPIKFIIRLKDSKIDIKQDPWFWTGLHLWSVPKVFQKSQKKISKDNSQIQ